MIINVHAGHNPAGKIASGAAGILNESVENRIVKDLVIGKLQSLGHTVYDCTCDNGKSSSDVLQQIVKKCNAHAVDLDVSIHFNAGGGYGVEVLIYDKSANSPVDIATNIAKSISGLGFKNRGVKVRPDLYVLKHTRAAALLIECCFVDSQSDASLYNPEEMATAIVKGITGQTVNKTQAAKSDSFLIKVKINEIEDHELNIRKGAGVEYPIVGVIKDDYKYTIVETAKASDGGMWGKLKSGIGWISINEKYVTRV